MPETLRQLRLLAGLAGRDLRHEWRVTLCLALAIAAVLAPLLVLFGLKSGIVDTFTARLKSDPRNLEIVWRLNGSLDRDWLARLRSDPQVGFAVPSTRTLAATLDLAAADGKGLEDVDLIPTDKGDPLFGAADAVPQGVGELALSHEAAARLSVSAGTRVEGILYRNFRQQRQVLRLPLRVSAVLAEVRYSGWGAFVSLPLLEALERYRDGYAVPELGVADGTSHTLGAPRYARLRLYARNLETVPGLAESLRGQGYDVSTRSKDIELVRNIDHALSFLFRLIAGVGVAGCVLSLGASLWASVERKRRDLALLRLVGIRNAVLAGFPAIQAAGVAAVGIALAFAAYFAAAETINRTFRTDLGRDEFVCRLLLNDGMTAALLTEMLAVLAALIAVAAVLRIEPGESLREI
ncbi:MULTISPECIES: FtsX-like permease family protein [Methylococcus]|uniref:ABC3 transporter permease C-terminal domain-containing protein n=1 Tax=Methylococcus capsulatus TaxID=414 RepID=A0ABZ2F4S8_METCP|nr:MULTISPECIES: FtsX-like permease family protein [Methylococcus]MDF9393502.1 FtsX-like permease family protein [Methylococcus capsulatus]